MCVEGQPVYIIVLHIPLRIQQDMFVDEMLTCFLFGNVREQDHARLYLD